LRAGPLSYINMMWRMSRYQLGFVISLALVALISDAILVTGKFCCDTLGMSEDLEGVTILA
jgi:hypothetical protein